MLTTLRGRFILSHILPLLVIVPLMGIALIYVLETRVLMPSLVSELTQQAALIADAADERSGVWTDPVQAQALVARLAPQLTARLMLLDPAGRLRASSDPADANRLGQVIDYAGLSEVQAGRTSVTQDYNRFLQADIADVWQPVMRPDGTVAGIIRLSYRLTAVNERFSQLRLMVMAVAVAAIGLGGAMGWLLAGNLERPITQVTHAVNQLAERHTVEILPGQQPAEIDQLVQAYNALARQLQALEDARHQLLANIVHELGRPLGALQSAVQALQGGAADDAALRGELLQGMADELHRLRRLLDDLHGHYDLAVGTLEIKRQRIDLRDWLPQVLAPWRAAAERQGLDWAASLPAEPLVVEIDPDRLGQAIGNLLSNALTYTPHGSISIAVRSDPFNAYLAIVDTGPGIAPADLARIFEPFYRSSAARRFPQGMGLGLAIARDIVTAHGGRLDVSSAPGAGSRFELTLPRPRAAQSPSTIA